MDSTTGPNLWDDSSFENLHSNEGAGSQRRCSGCLGYFFCCCCDYFSPPIQDAKNWRDVGILDRQMTSFGMRAERLIATLELPEQWKDHIRALYLVNAVKSKHEAKKNLSKHHSTNRITLWGGIFISFLILIQTTEQVARLGWQDYVFVLLMIMSVINNLAGGAQQLFNYWEMSRVHNEAFMEFEYEFNMFVASAEKYESRTHMENYTHFMESLVKVRDKEARELRNVMSKSKTGDGNKQPSVSTTPTSSAAAGAAAAGEEKGTVAVAVADAKPKVPPAEVAKMYLMRRAETMARMQNSPSGQFTPSERERYRTSPTSSYRRGRSPVQSSTRQRNTIPSVKDLVPRSVSAAVAMTATDDAKDTSTSSGDEKAESIGGTGLEIGDSTLERNTSV